mmetsp:Transcript_26486/g.47828  ORF Transcript_26486/g.47828 Transcript_26486/m.47828 type:complete len:219 (-) Transcript_26486:1685-2341(-)
MQQVVRKAGLCRGQLLCDHSAGQSRSEVEIRSPVITHRSVVTFHLLFVINIIFLRNFVFFPWPCKSKSASPPKPKRLGGIWPFIRSRLQHKLLAKVQHAQREHTHLHRRLFLIHRQRDEKLLHRHVRIRHWWIFEGTPAGEAEEGHRWRVPDYLAEILQSHSCNHVSELAWRHGFNLTSGKDSASTVELYKSIAANECGLDAIKPAVLSLLEALPWKS